MEANTLQKEIRIGNYLLGKIEDEIDERKVYWETYQIKDAEDLMGVKLDWDKPIPLSEEWLLELGFEETYRSEFTIKLELKEAQEVGFKWNQNFGWNFYYKGQMISNINFIHQIQNLTFALTEIELTIKE